MKQYLDLLQNILDNGVEKESGRENMPNTIGISHAVIQMDLQNGFPLLTTKKMYWKGIVHELLWFLRGQINIKYLVDNNVNIWNGDAYRWFKKLNKDAYGSESEMSIEQFLLEVKKGTTIDNLDMKYTFGDLGKVYGYNWRNIPNFDQVLRVIEGLKNNPYSRYHIINSWDIRNLDECALMPCHLLYQFIVRPLSLGERISLMTIDDTIITTSDFNLNKYLDDIDIPKFYLDLNMYQRSVDTFLGASFNLASMSLLLMIIAKISNMIAGIATWIGGDTHIYIPHIPMVREQIKRKPFPLSEMKINKKLNSLEDILKLNIDDFELIGYESHPSIKAELFTGLKK